MRRPDDGAGRARDTLVLLAGGAAGGALLTLLQVPAGTLIGAVLGSAAVNRVAPAAGRARTLPAWARGAGLVLLGCVAGVRLDAGTLAALARVALPVAASIAVLLALDLLLAWVLVRRYRIDPVTAVLACAPGGVSEIAVIASRLGARMGVVLAIHSVRVLSVVLLVLPVLVLVLRSP